MKGLSSVTRLRKCVQEVVNPTEPKMEYRNYKTDASARGSAAIYESTTLCQDPARAS